MLLDDIKIAIDMLDMQSLFKLALADPRGVINKISVRQLGKKRIEKLRAYLIALNKEKLIEHRSFEILLLTCCENELGVGLFSKTKNRR